MKNNKNLEEKVLEAAKSVLKSGEEVTGENVIKKLGLGWLYDTTYIVAASGKKYQRRYIQHNGVDVVRIDNVTKKLDKPQNGEKTAKTSGKRINTKRRYNCESLRRLSLAVNYAKDASIWLKDDTELTTAEAEAAAAFDYLCSLPNDNPAAAYIDNAVKIAAAEVENLTNKRRVINAAADVAKRLQDWRAYKATAKATAEKIEAQNELLNKLPEALRLQAIEAIKSNGTYIEAASPFFTVKNEKLLQAVENLNTTAAAEVVKVATKTNGKTKTAKVAAK